MTDDSYKLLDSGDLRKLEQIGPYRIVRPSPQAVWAPRLAPSEWQHADAAFTRHRGGDGSWNLRTKVADSWSIQLEGQVFQIKLTDFGHLGLFAEQLDNWRAIHKVLEGHKGPEPLEVLNLFAYTGGSTLAAASAGAKVTHVDASKTSNAWARENARMRHLDEHPIRWITDDVRKFLAREERRGSAYHGVILDPPSFGRGAKNEVWKIETDLPPLLSKLKASLAKDYRFVLLSAHSANHTPLALKNLLMDMVGDARGSFTAEEMIIREESGRALPSGAYAMFVRNRPE